MIRRERWALSLKVLATLSIVSACGAAPRDPGAPGRAGPNGLGGAAGTDTSEPAGGGGIAAGGSVNGGAGDAALPTGSGGSSSGGSAGSNVNATPVYTPTLSDAELATASGCAGVFNPDQLLTLAFDIDPGDFSQVLADTSYSLVVPAVMHCEGEAPLTVGIRRKRSGGREKVGFKIDMNAFAAGQEWYGLKKLSLENGVSEGDTEDGADVHVYVSEYLAWRLMVRSGAVSSRATFMAVEVNGEPLGVYVNVEQVDKRFLEERLGDDSGWLYKKSGGVNDGIKTNELGGADNPLDDYFCFWDSGNGCTPPSSDELLRDLPGRLDIPQFLRFGAVNALMGNADGPLFKDNNYYFYDYVGGPRLYIPWDLDTAMKDSASLYAGGGGGGNATSFDGVLFTHWRDDYTATLDDLLDNHVTLPVIQAELERVSAVAGAAFEADPYVTGTATDAVAALEQYWAGRLEEVRVEVP
jgi:hypothetical protein